MKRRPSLGSSRRHPWPTGHGERGQALVLFAGGLSVLLVAAGLVIDGGVAFQDRREAQNEADLGALAGTQVIKEDHTDGGRSGAQVYQGIADSLAANGCSAGGAVTCTWTASYVRASSSGGSEIGPVGPNGSIPSSAQGVSVQVHREPETFFLGLLGQDEWDVNAEGAALVGRMTGLPAGQVLPIGIDPPNREFEQGVQYNLTQEDHDAPGNFSWLSWTGDNSAGTLAESLCNPNNPAITFPYWMDGDPGKSNSSGVRACVDKWIARGTTMLIPLWDEVRGTGNNVQYRLTGIAAFVLTGYDQQAVDNLRGRFVEYYPLPSIGASFGSLGCGSGGDDDDDEASDCENSTIFMGLTR